MPPRPVCVYARETWREEELAKRIALTFLDRQRATQGLEDHLHRPTEGALERPQLGVLEANTATVVVTFYLNITLNGSYDKQNLISAFLISLNDCRVQKAA